MPCKAGENQVVFVNNKGGRSKGIGIMFTGDWIENDEIEICDATFESDYGSDKCKRVPITFAKKKDNTGKSILWWQDESFQIPPAVNPELPWLKKQALEFEKQFGVRFFVRGNERKFLDIKVFIIPLENYKKGFDCWYVYRSRGTKRKYVEKQNEDALRFLSFPPDLSEEEKQKILEKNPFYIDPDKYDLD